MPVGTCLHCRGRFVIESERSFQRTCPRCLRPLELTARDEGPEPSQPPPENLPSSSPSAELPIVCLNGVPLSADPVGQRLLAALAEAAYQREEARARRQKARELRERASAAREERKATAPAPAPERPTGQRSDDQGSRGGAGTVSTVLRARWLSERALVIVEKASDNCLRARMVLRQTRVARENLRLSRSPETELPPLDYTLFPNAAALPDFSSDEPALDDELQALPEGEWSLADLALEMGVPAPCTPRPRGVRTTLYVWGYGESQGELCREQCQATEAAIHFAAEAGWDAGRRGAWAKELTLPLGITAALRELEPLLRSDPAISGWELRMAPPWLGAGD